MTNNFDKVLNRAKQVIGASNDNKVSMAINMEPSAFTNRKKSGSIPFSHYMTFAESYNVNLNWLFQGVGPIYHDTNVETTQNQTDNPNKTTASKNSNLTVIEHIDLIKKFQDKETGKEFNAILVELEKLSPKEYYSLLGYAKRTLTELIKGQLEFNKSVE